LFTKLTPVVSGESSLNTLLLFLHATRKTNRNNTVKILFAMNKFADLK